MPGARRFLQVVFAFLGVLAITTGLASVIGGADVIPGVESVDESVESELRFYSAFWVVIGCVALWLVPRVESQPVVVRVIAAAIFAGGVARLIGLIMVGAPDSLMLILMAAELIVPPIVVAVQASLGDA